MSGTESRVFTLSARPRGTRSAFGAKSLFVTAAVNATSVVPSYFPYKSSHDCPVYRWNFLLKLFKVFFLFEQKCSWCCWSCRWWRFAGPAGVRVSDQNSAGTSRKRETSRWSQSADSVYLQGKKCGGMFRTLLWWVKGWLHCFDLPLWLLYFNKTLKQYLTMFA